MSEETKNKLAEVCELIKKAFDAIRIAVKKSVAKFCEFIKQFCAKVNRLRTIYSVSKYHCDIRLLKARHTYKERKT